MSTRRLFIGLMASPTAQKAISQYQLQYQWPPTVRLTEPAKLHLTLLFLGQVEQEAETRLRTALARVPMSPIYLRFAKPEMFSNGVAVIRPDESQPLELLQGDIAALVHSLGIASQGKQWLPHVTLARDADGCVAPRDEPAIEWDSLAFSLVWSRPDRGAGYEIVESWSRSS
jgi:2'-5' RNA ligase